MHDIVKYFPLVALADHRNDDRDGNQNDGTDYIQDTLHKWYGNDCSEYTEYNPIPDFSYSFRLKNEIIIVHLGTDTKAGGIGVWLSNTIGSLIIKEGMRSGFRKAGYDTFKKTEHLFKRTDCSITQLTHSRGVRGAVSSYLAAKRYGKRPRTFLYNPPEVFTKKGKAAYDKLNIPTISVLGHGDIVSNTGKFGGVFHIGNIINLPEPKGIIAKIPLIGNHAYSTDFRALMMMCLRDKDTEGYDYLASRIHVCTI